MTHHQWSIGRAGVALVAAYALALQALLASFGVGAAMVRHQVAAIAGVICSSAANAVAPAPVAPMEHDRADCGILCTGPGPALTGQVAALLAGTDGKASSRLAAPLAATRLGMIARLPGGARAPPALA